VAQIAARITFFGRECGYGCGCGGDGSPLRRDVVSPRCVIIRVRCGGVGVSEGFVEGEGAGVRGMRV
jgi:hypothetical protein